MNVTLKIENDEELRNYIKECIKGQVLSIVRDEYIEVVKAEITRKIASIKNRDFDYLRQSAFEAAAKELFLSNNGTSDWNNDFKPLLTEVLNKLITEAVKHINWQTIVDTLAKEKVKALIS